MDMFFNFMVGHVFHNPIDYNEKIATLKRKN